MSTWVCHRETCMCFHKGSWVCENKKFLILLLFKTWETLFKNNISTSFSANICAIVISWWLATYWKWQPDRWQDKPFHPSSLQHHKFHIWHQRLLNSHTQNHMLHEAFRLLTMMKVSAIVKIKKNMNPPKYWIKLHQYDLLYTTYFSLKSLTERSQRILRKKTFQAEVLQKNLPVQPPGNISLLVYKTTRDKEAFHGSDHLYFLFSCFLFIFSLHFPAELANIFSTSWHFVRNASLL